MYFYFLSNILSRQSNQKHFKNIKQFKVVPSKLNIFPFQAHLRPLSNKVYYRILNITQLTLSCTAFILPPLQHTEQCVIEHTHSIDADNLHPNITPEQCSALGKLGGYYPGADRREREQEQMYFLGSLQWQCSSNSYHVRLEECVEHVHNARDVVQHCAVQVWPRDCRGLHEQKRGPLDGSPRLSLDMFDSSNIKSMYGMPGPVLVAADAVDREGGKWVYGSQVETVVWLWGFCPQAWWECNVEGAWSWSFWSSV